MDSRSDVMYDLIKGSNTNTTKKIFLKIIQIKKKFSSLQWSHRVPDAGGGAGDAAGGGPLRARAEQEVRLAQAADGAGEGAKRAAKAEGAPDPGRRRVRGRRPRRQWPRAAGRGGGGRRCR